MFAPQSHAYNNIYIYNDMLCARVFRGLYCLIYDHTSPVSGRNTSLVEHTSHIYSSCRVKSLLQYTISPMLMPPLPLPLYGRRRLVRLVYVLL